MNQNFLFEELATPDPALLPAADPFENQPAKFYECYSFHERRVLPYLSREMTLADLAYMRIHFRHCAVEFREPTTSIRNYTIKRLDEKSPGS